MSRSIPALLATCVAASFAMTYASYNIVIGNGAGQTMKEGSCNILIGDGIDVPTPNTSYYINLDGKQYPNATRSEPWFQKVVRDRARKMLLKMTPAELAGAVLPFQGTLQDALKNIDEMSFRETECAPEQS